MTKFFLSSCVVLFFCFSNASAQQNQKVKSLLKGLRKATSTEMKNVTSNQTLMANLPKYGMDGEILQDEDLMQVFGGEKREYGFQGYADKNGKVQLLILRKLTASEKKGSGIKEHALELEIER